MDLTNIVNCSFGWFLVALAIVGFFVTMKVRGEKWSFWLVLAAGWAFFAMAETLLIIGVNAGSVFLIGIWLSSFVLVLFSMILFFLKFSRMRNRSLTRAK